MEPVINGNDGPDEPQEEEVTESVMEAFMERMGEYGNNEAPSEQGQGEPGRVEQPEGGQTGTEISSPARPIAGDFAYVMQSQGQVALPAINPVLGNNRLGREGLETEGIEYAGDLEGEISLDLHAGRNGDQSGA